MRRKRTGTASILGGGAALLPVVIASAVDFVWEGGGANGFWLTDQNWVGGLAPGLDLMGDNLVFGPSLDGNSFPNAQANAFTNIGGLSWTGADISYRIVGTGGSLTFADGAVISNNSTMTQLISTEVRGTGSSLIIESLTANLEFRRVIDLEDAGAITLTVRGDFDTGIFFGLRGERASLLKEGAGVLTIAGSNDFTDGTTLAAGTIILGNNAALGTGSLTLTGNGTIESSSNFRSIENVIDLGANTLTIGGNRNLTLEGVISGTGGLTIDLMNDRRVILTADNTFTGGTTVTQGDLQLDGTLASGVTLDGGVLTGGGTVTGDVAVRADAAISPERGAIGTLTIDGNYTQDTDGAFRADINTEFGTNDLLDISGTATLASGSTIELTTTGTRYVATGAISSLLEADGGITNSGVTLEQMNASATTSYEVDPAFMNGNTSLGIRLMRAADAYSAPADAGNNANLALALDQLIAPADANPESDAGQLLGALDALLADDYNTTISQLSPEPYRAGTDLALEATRGFASQQAQYLVSRRGGHPAWALPATPRTIRPGSLTSARNDAFLLAQAIAQADEGLDADPALADDLTAGGPEDTANNAWAQVQGIFGTQDTTANRTGYSASGVGGQIGFDHRFSDGFVAGVAIGFGYSKADLALDLGNLTNYGVRVGPYMTLSAGDWFLDASASFSYLRFESERQVPSISTIATGDYDGFEGTAYLGTGYQFELGRNVLLTPHATVQYSYLDVNGFSESGGGGANLRVDGRTSDSLRLRLGASLSFLIETKATIVPTIFGGWEYEALPEEDAINSSFVAGGGPFLVSIGRRDENSIYIGGGINVLFPNDLSAFLRYEYLSGDTSDVSAIIAGLSWGF